ncbi:TetR/AcrR family transcriptional regulator [Aureisphaera galaxeae]|uniref:TetR/AcrR family transcriptional regulator n=1 Tax=Aureisphaera galaxeae TaxID=1538023 RepID=UPI002350574A|nr:TetR/AcrR family transcriptional regulator [Aureisphaera galaxeae]MDC8005933.1 TetR/AcrR family transcriptional regulator [Aureisphaera galaxeae]
MKNQIVQTATDLFLNQGFKSITMDDIAQTMSISKKTIYSHFANKEAIVAVVVDNIFEEVSHGIDCISDLKMNPIEEIYEIKKLVMHHMRNEKTSPWYQLRKYYPKIHDSIKKRQFNYMQECVVDNLNRGLEQELFRENIDVQFVSRIYYIGVSGIKDNDLFSSTMFDPSELYGMFLEYHLRGIVTPKGRKILNKIIHSNQQ